MPPKRVKAEKGARESTARRSVRPSQAEDDVDMADQEQEEEDEAAKLERVLATIANYPDQPLEAIQEAKIRTLGTDITAHNQLYSQAIEAMTETAVMLADALPSGEDPFENEVSVWYESLSASFLLIKVVGDTKNQSVVTRAARHPAYRGTSP
jgi:hypothetical protein